jgi:diadenosine tetraphosphate (Ap4A) HIT family hydrolase
MDINECSECRLCTIVSKLPQKREDIEDTLLYQTEHFEWIPGLGSFVEGYSLIVSKSHVFNTGCFSLEVLEEIEHIILYAKKILKEIYKKDSVVFEHGSMGGRQYAGSCIEHQHLHILPIEIPGIPDILRRKFEKHTIDSIDALRDFNQKKVPYIYCMDNSGCHHVFEAPILARQYLRQVFAQESGKPYDWDWREKQFIENISSFVQKIQLHNEEKV